MDAVSARILALAPGSQEVSVAVEYHDRALATIEGIDVVLAVHADCRDLLERPPVRQLRPVLDDPVLEVAGTDDLSHLRSPSDFRHPRESGGPEPAPAWTAIALLDSRFRGNDENSGKSLNVRARIFAASGCKPAAACRGRIAAIASTRLHRHRGRRASRR